MCILNTLTPVLTLVYAVVIEVFHRCFTESASLSELGKPNSRAEIRSLNYSRHKAVKGALNGSALYSLRKKNLKISKVSKLLSCIC